MFNDSVKPGWVGPAADMIEFMKATIEAEEALIDPDHWDESSQVRLATLRELLAKAESILRESVGVLRTDDEIDSL